LIYQASDHVRRKFFAALLSPQLQASHGLKNLPVRNGDTVRIMRGDHKGFEGKVTRIDRARCRVYVEGLTREKVDGTAIFVPVHPSKVTITGLALDDKWRRKIVGRRKQAREAIETVEAKQVEEAVEPQKISEEEPAEEKVAPPRKPRTTKSRAKKHIVQKKTITQDQAEKRTRKEKGKTKVKEIEAETQKKPRKTADKSRGA
jgi:large subunit ribosomal protein L24